MIRVRLQDEVLAALKNLPPQPRHAIRLAIKGLTEERGDIRGLTDRLASFCRLRIGSYRVIVKYETIDGQRTATCVFLGHRNWVYEVFESRLQDD